jgi:general secretion pathway protein H
MSFATDMRSRFAPRQGGAKGRGRGMTLMEIMVVMAIIAFVMGGVVAGTGQVASARLKRSATMVSGAVKVAYTRASASSKCVRLVLDMERSALWLEEADQPMLVSRKQGGASSGGAEPATDAEKAALEETDRIVKGPSAPKARFKEVKSLAFTDQETGKAQRELGRNIRIRSVATFREDEPQTNGRAYVYFWPGGQTERAIIQLHIGTSKDDEDILSLLVSPLTGRVTVKAGAVNLDRNEGEDKSEREDREL